MFDLTTLWAWWQKYKTLTGPLLLGVVLFAAGWQTGKVMSPYYASHPIIFEDKECSDSTSSSGGSPAELQALQEQGVADAGETPEAPAATSTIAGTSSPTSQKLFVGSVNSNLFHHKDCSTASRIKEANQIWFASTEEAAAAGYSPSKCTRDKLSL